MGRKFGWHSGKLSCKELDVDDTLSFGNLNFGSVELDTILLNGRMATGVSAGGSSLALGSTYAYGEAIELRYNVTNWTGIGSSFKALYLRSEADLGGSFGLRCAELYGVMDTSTTTGLSNLQVLYTEMLIKASASNRTLTGGGSIEANISIENQTGTLTITNNIYCLYAKAQTGTGLADYTKVNGIKIAGRDDGTARVFGIALDISDPEATVCTWTTGISISTSCTIGIKVADGFIGQAIKVGSLSSTTPGTGCELSATNQKAVDVHADDNNAAIASEYTVSAIRGRLMTYATVQAECFAIHGLAKISGTAKTANVTAGIVGAFESTGTCSTATGSGNTYVAGVMGRVGTGGTFTIGAGTYVACVLAFGNNSNANAFTNTGYHAFHAALTDVGTPEVFDVGLYLEAGAMTTGIYVGSCTTGIQVTGTGAAVTSKAITTTGWTINNANLGDGYGIMEAELTLTGTVAGFVAASSSWINMISVTTGANYICAQSNGLYSEVGGVLTNGVFVFGMRAQCLLQTNGGVGGATFYPFSIVNNTNITTALIQCNAASSDLGEVSNAGSDLSTLVPLFKDGTKVGYVKIYALA